MADQTQAALAQRIGVWLTEHNKWRPGMLYGDGISTSWRVITDGHRLWGCPNNCDLEMALVHKEIRADFEVVLTDSATAGALHDIAEGICGCVVDLTWSPNPEIQWEAVPFLPSVGGYGPTKGEALAQLILLKVADE